MNAKKLAISLITVGVVGVAAFYGTRAFFSDTETSSGNTFAAGKVDLKVGVNMVSVANSPETAVIEPGDVNGQPLFSFSDLKPGDSGYADLSLLVDDNDAWACAGATVTDKPENTRIDPELPSDTTDDVGELQNYLKFAVVVDNDGTVGPSAGDKEILPPTVLNGFTSSGMVALQDAVTKHLETTGPMLGGKTYNLLLAYCFGDMDSSYQCSGAPDANDAQTDGVKGNLDFYAVQSRNNEQFVCGSLNKPEITTTTGAGFGDAQFEDQTRTFYGRVRFGKNTSWQLAAGVDPTSGSGYYNANYPAIYTNNPGEYSFEVAYDKTANTVTTTVDGTVSTAAYTVPTPSNNADVALTVRAPFGGMTEVKDVEFNGVSVGSPDSVLADGTSAAVDKYLLISGADTSDSFTVTGTLKLSWGANVSQEQPALYVDID